MKKKKMAIISSYSESCGNASFTRILHDSIECFRDDVQVEVLELDLKLLQSIDRKIRGKADKHIDEICVQLRGFDSVNIQMEAGLYGTLPHDIVRRFSRLVSVNPVTSVTLHSPRLTGTTQSASRGAIKKLLKLDLVGGLREIIGDIYGRVHLRINEKIIKAAIGSGARLIVHTGRAKKQIKDFFSYDKVAVHPLKMVPDGYVANSKTLESIAYQASLAADDVLIGMFGYISEYKGHTDALKALKSLSGNYKLLVFGRQHPQTLKSNGVVDKYLGKLIQMVMTDDSLKDRVLFMGELNDQDFLDVASSVDVAWLPYYENGQDGSGIASICLDLSPRVLCSTSFAFDELFKLVKYNNVTRFDIGNTLEMALKTEMVLRASKPIRPFCVETVYNLRSQATVYAEGLVA